MLAAASKALAGYRELSVRTGKALLIKPAGVFYRIKRYCSDQRSVTDQISEALLLRSAKRYFRGVCDTWPATPDKTGNRKTLYE